MLCLRKAAARARAARQCTRAARHAPRAPFMRYGAFYYARYFSALIFDSYFSCCLIATSLLICRLRHYARFSSLFATFDIVYYVRHADADASLPCRCLCCYVAAAAQQRARYVKVFDDVCARMRQRNGSVLREKFCMPVRQAQHARDLFFCLRQAATPADADAAFRAIDFSRPR